MLDVVPDFVSDVVLDVGKLPPCHASLCIPTGRVLLDSVPDGFAGWLLFVFLVEIFEKSLKNDYLCKLLKIFNIKQIKNL